MTESHPPLFGRVVLVTGAGQGLGKAIALAAANAGATVVLHGRQLKKIERVYDLILAQDRAEPLLLPLDLARLDDAACTAVADAVAKQFGRLDGLVHCAADLPALAPFSQWTLAQWDEVLRVNLSAPAALTRSCLDLLRASGQGRVIFTLADRGQEPRAYWGAYAAAKAGLSALLRVLQDEWENESALAAFGVVPGPLHSPLRIRTYPGAGLQDLPAAEALAPLYIELLQAKPKPHQPIISAQDWLQRLSKRPPRDGGDAN